MSLRYLEGLGIWIIPNISKSSDCGMVRPCFCLWWERCRAPNPQPPDTHQVVYPASAKRTIPSTSHSIQIRHKSHIYNELQWIRIPCWGIQFRFRCISQIRLPSERPRSSLHRRPLGSRPAKLVKTKINIEIRKKIQKINTKKIPLRVRWKVFDFKNMPCSPACVVNLHVCLHLPFFHMFIKCSVIFPYFYGLGSLKLGMLLKYVELKSYWIRCASWNILKPYQSPSISNMFQGQTLHSWHEWHRTGTGTGTFL